jgi:hypothetical protein
MFDFSGMLKSIVVIAIALVYANFFEYALHRWLMHGLRGFVKREHMRHHGHLSRRPSLSRAGIRGS